jgi:hypothetical protein
MYFPRVACLDREFSNLKEKGINLGPGSSKNIYDRKSQTRDPKNMFRTRRLQKEGSLDHQRLQPQKPDAGWQAHQSTAKALARTDLRWKKKASLKLFNM